MTDLGVKKYISKKTLSIVALVVFCTLTLLVIYYILPKIPSTKKTEDEKTDGGFNTVQFAPLEKDEGKLEGDFDELVRIMASENPASNEDYWDGWSWETHMIEAFVEEVDTDLGDLMLRIIRPPGYSLYDKLIRVNIECPADKTVAYGNGEVSPAVIGYNFNLVDKVAEGDLVWGYCMQEECLSIGKKCILLKTTH